jgi:hypothetical protein
MLLQRNFLLRYFIKQDINFQLFVGVLADLRFHDFPFLFIVFVNRHALFFEVPDDEVDAFVSILNYKAEGPLLFLVDLPPDECDVVRLV